MSENDLSVTVYAMFPDVPLAFLSPFAGFGFVIRHPGLVLVLIGVVGEVICDWKEMSSGHLGKAKQISAILLVLGLAIEFIEAAASDKEVAETRQRTANVESTNLLLRIKLTELEGVIAQTTSNVVAIDPLNQPVSDVSADVQIVLKGSDFVESPHWGGPSVAWLELCGTGMQLYQVGELSSLNAGTFSRLRSDADHGYILHFQRNFVFTRNFATSVPSVSHMREKVGGLRISAKFIPHDSEVIRGSAEMVINGWCSKRFQILPQRAFTGHEGLTTNAGDTGFTLLATNAIAPDFLLPKGEFRSGW